MKRHFIEKEPLLEYLNAKAMYYFAEASFANGEKKEEEYKTAMEQFKLVKELIKYIDGCESFEVHCSDKVKPIFIDLGCKDERTQKS